MRILGLIFGFLDFDFWIFFPESKKKISPSAPILALFLVFGIFTFASFLSFLWMVPPYDTAPLVQLFYSFVEHPLVS